MTAALDRLRQDLQGARLWSPRGLLSVSGPLAVCCGLAIALHDALDPDPLVGWQTGLGVAAAGVALAVLSSLLLRRRHDRLAARLGVSRADADAVWSEDDDE